MTATRLITERLQNMNHGDARTPKENIYLRNMEEAYMAVLVRHYAIAQRGEAA